MRSGEQLASTGKGVERTLDGKGGADEGQQRALAEVLISQPLAAQLLPLGDEGINLLLDREGGLEC